MKTTGSLLKSHREAQKMSIAEVSISTKITPRMLNAMENGDMSILPAKTFLRGFVKSYAAHLKLDMTETLKTFNDEMKAMEPAPVVLIPNQAETNPQPASADKQNLISPPADIKIPKQSSEPLIAEGMSQTKKISLGVGVVALIGIIVFVYKMIGKYEKEAQIVSIPPTSVAKIENPTPAKSPEPTPPTAQPPTPPVAPKVELKKTEMTKTEPVAPSAQTPPATPTPDPSTATKPTTPSIAVTPAQTKELPKVDVVKKDIPTPKEAVVATEAKPATETAPVKKTITSQEIIIEALDKVEITFRINGGEEKKVALQPEQYHTIRGSGVIALDLSNGGAVNIIHNGRDMGVPGDLGRPKKMQIP